MRISRKGEYALRAMTYLAHNYRKVPVQIHEISQREKIPEKFLEQILLQLKRAGLLDSKRGARGGYALIRPPKKVSLADIIRTIDGALAPLGCVSKWAHVRCPEEKNCGLRRLMLDVRNVVARMLEGITLEDVCAGGLSEASRRQLTGKAHRGIGESAVSLNSSRASHRRRPPAAGARKDRITVRNTRRRVS